MIYVFAQYLFFLFLFFFSRIYVSVISIVFKLLSCVVFFAVLFVVHHCIVLILGKFGWPHPGKAQQLQKQCYPFLSACGVFSCVQTMLWLPVFGFLTCAQMLMHATAHGGCRDTVGESALEDGSERKIPCRLTDSNLRQYCA